MSNLKTRAMQSSVTDCINRIENDRRREDAKILLALFKKITEKEAVMWGDSIIGFGSYTYELASGRREQFLRSGFSPRKQNLSVYVGAGMSEHPKLLEQLGKHKRSKACLYINKLADIDMAALEALVRADLSVMEQRYPNG